MLAAILDTDPGARPSGVPLPWTPDRIPTDQELLQRTLAEFVRRPEKLIRLSVQSLRELAASTQVGGLRILADLIAQPMPGPLGSLMRHALRQRLRVRGRPTASPATDGRAANAVEQVDLTPPEVRLHHHRARLGEAGAAGDRLHVQRRRDGDLLRDAAALPPEARLPARRVADRDGAGECPLGCGDRQLLEPGVGDARRPGDERARSRRSGWRGCSAA